MMESSLVLKLISRVLHFLASGYIIGYVGIYLWAMAGAEKAQGILLHEAFNLNLTSGVIVALTGFLGIVLILYERTHPALAVKNEFVKDWFLILLAKVVACVFLTGFTDWLVTRFLSFDSLSSKSRQEIHRFYIWVGSIKLTALLIVMVLSTYAKIYRENITENFTKSPHGEYRPLAAERLEQEEEPAYKPLVERQQ